MKHLKRKLICFKIFKIFQHLWTVAVEEAQLLHELRLMKDFYLLGRGELFLELLRLTAPMLDKPTTRTSTRGILNKYKCL